MRVVLTSCSSRPSPVRDGRRVIDETGLTGFYAVRMEFNPSPLRNGPAVAPPADDPPPLVTALQDQLGLRLVPSPLPTLVIDRLERPLEN